MQNLYDLLGVRPDDDAETLKSAFRKAAKATHPDHHGGDPKAAVRFRQISAAYEILRDGEQRAAYDRLLESECRPLRHEVKRSAPGMKRHVVHDLMAGALLAVLLTVGYELFARVPGTPGDGATAVTARESGQAAAERPVELPAGQTAGAASRDSEADVPAGAGVSGKTGGEPPVQHDAPSLDAPISASEERNGIPAADDRRDGKTQKPAGANADGVKLPEIKTSAHATAAAAKRHTPNRSNFEHEQAALENRNIPAPDNAPSRPFFGVGF
jgi:curved DNA-binding protein CbpA